MKEYFIWLMKFITIIVVFFILVPIVILSLAMASSKTLNAENIIPQEKNLVAVIDVNGVIMDSKDVIEKLYKFSADDDPGSEDYPFNTIA